MFNWAFIGTGTIVRKFIKGLSAVEGANLYAVGSRNISRAEEFAKEFGIEKAYGDISMLAADDNIDCVYIGVPHALHKPYMELCIKKGRNVLCEKPFTINEAEAKQIAELAKEYGVFVMEAAWTKFLPVIIKVKELLESGAVGEVCDIRASFGFFSETDVTNRLYDLELGGGALLDVGVYPLMLALYYMDGCPDEIESDALIGATGVDEINHFTLVYNRDGRRVTAQLSSALKENQGADAVITTTKGRVVIPDFYQAQEAYVYDSEGKLIQTISHSHSSNGYEFEARAVQTCIAKGIAQCDVHTLDDTIDILKIADGMRKEWGLVYPADNMQT